MQTQINQLKQTKELIINFLRRLPWRGVLIIGALLVFEISMHPLGVGPDRRIHDPGVARFIDPQSFPGDWYADAAQASGVYPFYGALISLGSFFSIGEERWRLSIYIASLLVLYFALFRIARVFSDNPLVVPLIAIFHAAGYLYDPPAWLYGPFMHIDGGLAPRSIGVSFSLLAVAFFLEKRKVAPWFILGIATLIHVSNSMLVFFVLLATGMIEGLVDIIWQTYRTKLKKGTIRQFLYDTSIVPATVYFLSGGWFILTVASHNMAGSVQFTTEKFIWTWVYFRAPYMALPEIPYGSWILFVLYLLAIIGSLTFLFFLLRRKRKELFRFGLISFLSLMAFVIFYVFTFVYPWLPGFQLYSFRIIYLVYATAYTLLAVTIVVLPKYLANQFAFLQRRMSLWKGIYVLGIGAVFVLFLSENNLIERYEKRAVLNLLKSIEYLRVPKMPPPITKIESYLLDHQPSAYLAPPDWNGPPQYTSVASFKVFGFTRSSLPLWYDRMDVLSRGELSKQYDQQKKQGKFKPTVINWRETYGMLSVEELNWLQKKWGFSYFVTYPDRAYPYSVIIEDEKYVLYEIDGEK